MASVPGQGIVLVERRARIMATDIAAHVACPSERGDEAAQAVEQCFEWLREVDRTLTRFEPASDLCRLNAAAGQWTHVSPLLYMAVEQSVLAAEASEGLFDPTILPLLEWLGYDRDFKLLSDGDRDDIASQTPQIAWSRGEWRHIEIDRVERRLRLPANTRLDLGGIAKGWAADEAVARFFAAFPDVLLTIGGDMRARGRGADGEPWAIGVADPRARASTAERHIAVVSTAGGGVACSGATETWWLRAGERRHHLLDPRTGRPARLWITAADDEPDTQTLIATVTAFAPTAAHAEVAAKVAALRGCPDALRAVETAWRVTHGGDPAPYTDAGVALLLVMGSGQVVCSANLSEWLATWGGGGELWLE